MSHAWRARALLASCLLLPWSTSAAAQVPRPAGATIANDRQPAQPASSDEAAILSVIDRFMDGITNNDAALLAEVHVEGSFTVVARPNPAGGDPLVVRRAFTPPRANGRSFRERYWDPVVHVRGGIAVVWTPYEFWIDGKTSHCGIDVFDLMKEKGVWKIVNAMWTVEPDACAALRPSDPSRVRPAR